MRALKQIASTLLATIKKYVYEWSNADALYRYRAGMSQDTMSSILKNVKEVTISRDGIAFVVKGNGVECRGVYLHNVLAEFDQRTRKRV